MFVLSSFKSRSSDFVVVPTGELRRRLQLIHKFKAKVIQSYLWVTERNRCWEARSLQGGVDDKRLIREGVYNNRPRDFTTMAEQAGMGPSNEGSQSIDAIARSAPQMLQMTYGAEAATKLTGADASDILLVPH